MMEGEKALGLSWSCKEGYVWPLLELERRHGLSPLLEREKRRGLRSLLEWQIWRGVSDFQDLEGKRKLAPPGA